jgi:hypothetical protein
LSTCTVFPGTTEKWFFRSDTAWIIYVWCSEYVCSISSNMGHMGLPSTPGKQPRTTSIIYIVLGISWTILSNICKEVSYVSPPIPTSRKEWQHYILLKAVYLGTFQYHAWISPQKSISPGKNNNQPAPNCNPLYILSTMPHQPSPRNNSPLARIIICHMVRSCIMVHLQSSHDGHGLFSGVWGSQAQVIRLGCSPERHLGKAAIPAPHTHAWY